MSSSTASDYLTPLLKTPSRKRTHTPEDGLHESETKRRRSSLPYGFVLGTELAQDTQTSTFQRDICDRFIGSVLTADPFYPIHMMNPRTTRLARALGYVDRRLLSYHDSRPHSRWPSHWSLDPTLHCRILLSQRLWMPSNPPRGSCSAAKQGRKKPDRILDSGPMDDYPPHPCAWSSTDIIAVVLRGRVFTHRMDTTTVLDILPYGHARCVAWTSGHELAVGHELGCAVMLDARTAKIRRSLHPVAVTQKQHSDRKLYPATAMSWSEDRGLLAVGQDNGVMTYYDPRSVKPIRTDSGDSARSILGIQWSPDGMYLASGFESGIVRCTDWRANKSFELKSPQRKTAHRNAVKSLTWAPWNPHLLATGGSATDHTVRLWSISNLDVGSPEPIHTLSLSSNISSLHFSPHTTELLSTHGEGVPNPPCSRIRRRSAGIANANRLSPAPTRHALLVHSYPSLQRVFSIPNAHSKPIIDSVLSPDGTRIMTFGEDETIRFWTIWGARKPEQTFKAMDQHMIR